MAECSHPMSVKLKNPLGGYGKWIFSVPIPCGKCMSCKKNRINQWQVRLQHELKNSENAYFVTLTYNTDNLPFNMQTGIPELRKTDLQNFFKRLRNHEKESKREIYCREQYERKQRGVKFDTKRELRYYACGEYGTRRRRPHYHFIGFNIYNSENIIKAWSTYNYEIGEFIPMGKVDIDPDVNTNNIDYVLKYIEKDSKHNGFYKYNGMQTEFSCMSKGLGESYITEETKKWHENIEKNYVMSERGYKVPMPKYYSKKLYEYENPELPGKVEVRDQYKRLKHVKKLVDEKQDKEMTGLKAIGINYDERKNLIAHTQKNYQKSYKKRDHD